MTRSNGDLLALRQDARQRRGDGLDFAQLRQDLPMSLSLKISAQRYVSFD